VRRLGARRRRRLTAVLQHVTAPDKVAAEQGYSQVVTRRDIIWIVLVILAIILLALIVTGRATAYCTSGSGISC